MDPSPAAPHPSHEALPGAKRPGDSILWPGFALALVLALQFQLVFTRAINWDEFFYFHEVHRFAAEGYLGRGLQTLHVRLFSWIVGIGETPVDGIVVARCVMFACEVAAIAAIAGIAGKFTDRATGLVCALCYVSAGFVFQHGFSFRTDPMAAAGLMGALWILCCSRLSTLWLVAFGILVATASMITIKVVLYAPVFAGIAWYRWAEAGYSAKRARRLAGAAAITGAVFGLLYLAHSSGVTAPAPESTAGATAGGAATAAATEVSAAAKRATAKMFSLGPQPYWADALRSATLAIVFTALIAFVPVTILSRSRPVAVKIALAGAFLPLTTLIFYHNTAPYYYAFMLPPVAVSICLVVAWLRERLPLRIFGMLLAVNALVVWAMDGESRIDNQRQVISAAHRIFPKPVSYFDFCFMLPGFPKANGFMTLWGVDDYLASGRSIYRDALNKRPVPLLLENDPMFTRAMREGTNHDQFTQEDLDTLRATYIHFWGPLWLAGQELSAADGARMVELLVPGEYTIRGGPIAINGKRAETDEVVRLERGTYRLEAMAGDARLVWGNRLEVPSEPEPGEIWTYF